MITLNELLQAVEDEEAVCVACGEVQEWQEPRHTYGLCQECGEYQVLPAEEILMIYSLVDKEEEDV